MSRLLMQRFSHGISRQHSNTSGPRATDVPSDAQRFGLYVCAGLRALRENQNQCEGQPPVRPRSPMP